LGAAGHVAIVAQRERVLGDVMKHTADRTSEAVAAHSSPSGLTILNGSPRPDNLNGSVTRSPTYGELAAENRDLQRRCQEAEESCMEEPTSELRSPSGESSLSVPRDVFDLDAAVNHCLGRAELFSEMVDYFFQEADASVEHIRSALGKSDAADIAYHAHRFVGTISHLGATSALLATRRVEHLGRSGDLRAADEAIARLDQQIAVLKEVLAEYRTG
jgi:HPt (histidine-containing phosphotransfer) domain-containing protein